MYMCFGVGLVFRLVMICIFLHSVFIFVFNLCLLFTGRRYTGQQPGHYVTTGSSVNPVVKRNHWQEPTYPEAVAHDEVHQLQVRNTCIRRGIPSNVA